jgi:hypothetical protein
VAALVAAVVAVAPVARVAVAEACTPGRGRSRLNISVTSLDKNRRCIGKSQPPKRMQRPPHLAASVLAGLALWQAPVGDLAQALDAHVALLGSDERRAAGLAHAGGAVGVARARRAVVALHLRRGGDGARVGLRALVFDALLAGSAGDVVVAAGRAHAWPAAVAPPSICRDKNRRCVGKSPLKKRPHSRTWATSLRTWAAAGRLGAAVDLGGVVVRGLVLVAALDIRRDEALQRVELRPLRLHCLRGLVLPDIPAHTVVVGIFRDKNRRCVGKSPLKNLYR